MSSQADGTPEQIAFGRWVEEHLAYLKEVKGISMRAACRRADVSHTQVYAWMGQPESTGYNDASPAAVKKFCTAFGFDYAEAARILGWTKSEKPETHRDLDGFIRRAKAMAAHPKTSEERRRELQERIDDAEATQRMQRRAEELLREALGEDQPER
ncbi:hypothetical protein [Glycomyces arizonensis]|uniref:hypothetical protein n=1 Tax=Glycomyces arizonensis TaxID=256035 RepID=UPI0003FA1F79|nr:hypothetical protein [Glycomyces arizonensis]